MRAEYSANLRELQKSIAREMSKRENSSVKQFRTLDKIWVIQDNDFNIYNRKYCFPYIDLDGKIEIYTKRDIAQNRVDYIHKERLGHVTVCEISGQNNIINILNFFRRRMGISVFHFDNGTSPVEIRLTDIVGPLPKNLLERSNDQTKLKFVRALQYERRLQKWDSSGKGSDAEQRTKEEMFSIKYSAYRDFANGLCYALTSAPYQAGTTLYTEKALAKAKEMLAQYELTENALIAEGDNTFAVYDSAVQLQAASIHEPGKETEEAFACAFTDHTVAESVRKGLLKTGNNFSILVMTYDEQRSGVMQNTGIAGIIIDWCVYDFIIPKKEFQNVELFRKAVGEIKAKMMR